MINEISRNLPGVTGARPKSEPGKITATQEGGLVTGTPKGEPVVQKGTAKSAPVEKTQLNGMIDELNGLAQVVQRQLEFSIDEDNGEVVVKVVDAETRDVVREIPPEEIREMRKRLSEISEKLFQKNEKTALLFQAKA